MAFCIQFLIQPLILTNGNVRETFPVQHAHARSYTSHTHTKLCLLSTAALSYKCINRLIAIFTLSPPPGIETFIRRNISGETWKFNCSFFVEPQFPLSLNPPCVLNETWSHASTRDDERSVGEEKARNVRRQSINKV